MSPFPSSSLWVPVDEGRRKKRHYSRSSLPPGEKEDPASSGDDGGGSVRRRQMGAGWSVAEGRPAEKEGGGAGEDSGESDPPRVHPVVAASIKQQRE